MLRNLIFILIALLVTALAACASNEPESREIALMTHDSFDVSEEVIAIFEEAEGVTVTILPSGDAGTALNQAILAREDPLADVLYGVDNTFMGRALVTPSPTPAPWEAARETPPHVARHRRSRPPRRRSRRTGRHGPGR